ncbi:MAG: hypothetical protein OEW46_13115 [Actinomycetota bacterium]|nr:hypothetical protein [Actinomycetota bacterium]
MAAKGKHYLLLVLPDGKAAIRREYIELLSPEETIEEAEARWIEERLGNRQRNRAKVAGQLRESVLERRLCHPSSWIRERREAAAG